MHAQQAEYSGFYVNNEGDTVQASFKPSVSGASSIPFMAVVDGNSIDLSTQRAQFVVIHVGGKTLRMRRLEARINLSRSTRENPADYKEPDYVTRTLFAEPVVTGAVNYYLYSDEYGKTHHILTRGGLKPASGLVQKYYLSADGNVQTLEMYKRQLYDILGDCDAVTFNDIKNIRLNVQAVKGLVKAYNVACSGEGFTDYTKDNALSVRLLIGAGAVVTDVDFDVNNPVPVYDLIQPSEGLSFSGAVGMEIDLSRYTGRMLGQLMLDVNTFSWEDRRSEVFMDQRYDLYARLNFVELSLLAHFHHALFTAGPLRVYAGLGLGGSYFISDQSFYRAEIFRDGLFRAEATIYNDDSYADLLFALRPQLTVRSGRFDVQFGFDFNHGVLENLNISTDGYRLHGRVYYRIGS